MNQQCRHFSLVEIITILALSRTAAHSTLGFIVRSLTLSSTSYAKSANEFTMESSCVFVCCRRNFHLCSFNVLFSIWFYLTFTQMLFLTISIWSSLTPTLSHIRDYKYCIFFPTHLSDSFGSLKKKSKLLHTKIWIVYKINCFALNHPTAKTRIEMIGLINPSLEGWHKISNPIIFHIKFRLPKCEDLLFILEVFK